MSVSTPVPQILFFTASWCPHCPLALLAWKEFCRDFDDIDSLLCITVDCTDQTPRGAVDALIMRHEVECYPCVRADVGAASIKLDKLKITYESLKNFAEEALGRKLVPVSRAASEDGGDKDGDEPAEKRQRI